MPASRPSEKDLAALKVLWENKTIIGCCIYTFEAGNVLKRSLSSSGLSSGAIKIRKLEEKGFFDVCGRVGWGGCLEVKWTDKGIECFGGEKPKLASLPVSLPAGLAKDPPKKPVKPAKRIYKPRTKKSAPETANAYAPIVPKPGPAPERIGVIFVDWDNIALSAAEEEKTAAAGSELNNRLFRAIVEKSIKFVDKADIFIYTAEGHIDRNPLLLLDAEEDWNVELIVVPSEKDAADAAIDKKAEEIAASRPGISCFVFVSGDGYFIPAVEKLIRAKKKIILLPYSSENLNHRYYDYTVRSNVTINFLKPLMGTA